MSAAADAARHVLFEIEDDIHSLGRLLLALMYVGQAMTDREAGDAIEGVAAIAHDQYWRRLKDARLQAWTLLKADAGQV